ncbi:MAG: tetratricopeptide repeat protein [bacterium]
MAKIKQLSHNSLQEKAIERAKKYIADENYVDAKDEIEKVLDANPADDRALNLLAIVMLKLEQFGRAVKIYEDLIIRYPKTLPLHTNLGVAYLKNNQYENAIKEFSFVLDKEPNNKTVLKLYGKALLGLNRIDEAAELFRKAGMDEYAKNIKKRRETDETVEPELSTEDITEDTMEKSVDNKVDIEHQQIPSEQQATGDETNVPEEVQPTDEKIEEVKETGVVEEEAKQPFTTQPEEEEIIETERGPSAIEEQEIMEEYSGIEDQEQSPSSAETVEQKDEGKQTTEKEGAEEVKEEQTVQEEVETREDTTAVEPHRDEQSVVKSQETPSEQEKPEEQEMQEEQETQAEQTKEGLSLIAEETSLSKYNAPVNFINNSLLTFNLNGNIIYVRDKGIVALGEGLTLEQAYKRYRGKDTKSLFAEKKDDPIVLVYGKGILLLETEYNIIHEITLRNESIFLEDERLLAFYGDLEWENGRIEIKADKSINVTQMKGTASVFVGLNRTLQSIEVSTEHYLSVRLNALVGWYGKLIPRQTSIKHYNNYDYISFYGEGVVFIDA